MSRIGRKPIPVPSTVTVTVEPEVVRVNGPRGNLEERKNRAIEVVQEDGNLLVTRPTDRAEHRALHGLTRSLIANMVEGVTTGFTKTLEIQGVGYRALLKGRDLELALGYSHPVPIKAPEGIEFEVPIPTRIIVKGNNKQVVGEIAAIIRKQRPPEPYKGKGVRYQGEYVARKVGRARMTVLSPPTRRLKRRRRVRAKMHGTAERPRISVFRSNRGAVRPAHRRRRGSHDHRGPVDRGRAALAQADGAGHGGGQAARFPRQGRRHRLRRVRSRRLPVPRPCQGPG